MVLAEDVHCPQGSLVLHSLILCQKGSEQQSSKYGLQRQSSLRVQTLSGLTMSFKCLPP